MLSGVKDPPGLRRVTAEEVSATIIDVLERPRFAAFVPKRMGPMALMLSATPFRLRQWLARVTRTDTLMLQADAELRAGYEAHVSAAAPPRNRG
jgi:hypothetical protein